MSQEGQSVAISSRVDPETREELTEVAEAEDRTKSEMIEKYVKRGIDNWEGEDDRAADRSVSALTILGVVSFALAPTLLASGQIAAGALLSMVAGVYALLWVTATDVVVEEAIAGARSELREAGGVIALFRSARKDRIGVVALLKKVFSEDRVVEEPQTLVERLTYADVLGFVFGGLAIVLATPLVVGVRLGYTDAIVQSLGGVGFLLYFVVILALAYLFTILFGISALASLAVVTSSSVSSPAEVEAGDADTE